MLFQASTLTALCALSVAHAREHNVVNSEQLALREDQDSKDEVAPPLKHISPDSYVPTKILRMRLTEEERLLGKSLKNPIDEMVKVSDVYELHDTDLGILEENAYLVRFGREWQLHDKSEDERRRLDIYNPGPVFSGPECQDDGGRGCWEPSISCDDYCSQFGTRPRIIPTSEKSFQDFVLEYLDGASPYDVPMNCWDTSVVKDMSYAFTTGGCTYRYGTGGAIASVSCSGTTTGAFPNNFNSPVGCWDTSAATNMSGMFFNQVSFNQPINTWNTSRVKNMRKMFTTDLACFADRFGLSAFNQPIDNWDTSKVISTYRMFDGAVDFNQPVGSLVTRKTRNVGFMFSGSGFNQPVDAFDTSGIKSTYGMFSTGEFYEVEEEPQEIAKCLEAPFNQPVDSWDMSSVTDMGYMFRGLKFFNAPVNNWDTSSLEWTGSMFLGTPFNQPVDAWDTSKVTNTADMFKDTTDFNQSVMTWDTGKIKKVANMFKNASAFNQALNSWNTKKINDMSGMFDGASAFNQALDSWDTSSVTSMRDMFKDAVSFNQPIDNWDISGALPKTGFSSTMTMDGMFNGAAKFNQCLGTWGEKSSISSTFSVSSAVKNSGCPIQDDPEKFFVPWCQGKEICEQTLPVGYKWSPKIDCDAYCEQFGGRPEGLLELGESARLFAGYVDNPSYNPANNDWDRVLFERDLQSSPLASEFRNVPINCWDTSEITDFSKIFAAPYFGGRSALNQFNEPLGCWDTSKATTMEEMFVSGYSFNQPIDNWDVSGVLNTSTMFYKGAFNQCLSTWADKTPDDVVTDNMFFGSQCPFGPTPDPTMGPWCQACVACEDSPAQTKFNVGDKKNQNCRMVKKALVGMKKRKEQEMGKTRVRVKRSSDKRKQFIKDLCPRTFGICPDQCKDSRKRFDVPDGPNRPLRCSDLDSYYEESEVKSLCKSTKVNFMSNGKVKPLKKLCEATCGRLGYGRCSKFLSVKGPTLDGIPPPTIKDDRPSPYDDD